MGGQGRNSTPSPLYASPFGWRVVVSAVDETQFLLISSSLDRIARIHLRLTWKSNASASANSNTRLHFTISMKLSCPFRDVLVLSTG